jgi:hypothetical protein
LGGCDQDADRCTWVVAINPDAGVGIIPRQARAIVPAFPAASIVVVC